MPIIKFKILIFILIGNIKLKYLNKKIRINIILSFLKAKNKFSFKEKINFQFLRNKFVKNTEMGEEFLINW